jgi:prevent-host-death family protein
MVKRVSASHAKNNFGGLLDDVATLGRVDIVKHGRLVAVVLSPRAFDARQQLDRAEQENPEWGKTHMIPPNLARQARLLEWPAGFDDE